MVTNHNRFYIVARKFNEVGCIAYKCKNLTEARNVLNTLEAIRAKDVQIGGKAMERNVYMELVNSVVDIMGERIVRIVLYGSAARGTASEDSDIDIALLINGSMDKKTEDKLSDIIVDMNLKYDKVFSVIDIEFEKFCRWENVMPFYQNINKEGIVLWRAA